MFGTPTAELTLDTVLRFLRAGVREGISLDYKSDFPEHLERVLAAFANTSGGLVLIGVEENTPTGTGKYPPCGIELRPRLRERVLQIGLDAVYPPIVPEVQVISFSSSDSNADPDRAVVVVRVHESEQTPHAVDGRTAIYLRTDSVSSRFLRKATLGELEWLVNKRHRSLAERQRILNVVERHAGVYRDRRAKNPGSPKILRKGRFVFYTVPHYPHSPLKEHRELLKIAETHAVRIPAVLGTLPSGRPQPVAEGIVFEHEYGTTELQQQGMVYHMIEFWWEPAPTPAVTPGCRAIPPQATAALLFGALEFAAQTYPEMGFAGLIDVEFGFSGVRDALFRHPENFDDDAAYIVDDAIVVHRTHTVADLREGTIAIAKDCQRELYWSCGINAGDGLLRRDFMQVERFASA